VRHAIPVPAIAEFCAPRGLDVCLGWQAIRRAQATIIGEVSKPHKRMR
jgi:hypothetical protein